MNRFRCFLGAIALGVMAAPALAAVPLNFAFIKTSHENGSGYLVRKGPDCFAVTARHVVVTPGSAKSDSPVAAPDLMVYDEQSIAAPAQLVFNSRQDDLAVLKVLPSDKFACTATWQEGGSVKDVLRSAVMDTSTTFRVLTLRETGNLDASEARLLSTQGASTFTISTTSSQGQSGSPVITGNGVLMGIVLNTSGKDNSTTVLRQDYINSIAGAYTKTQGVKILLYPILDDQGRRIDTAAAAARQYFETLPNIIPREPLPSEIAPDGSLTNTGDAQYIFQGHYLTGNINTKKSALGMLLGAGKAIRGLSNLADQASNIAGGAGMSGEKKTITLRIEFLLTNLSTRDTFTDLEEFKKDYPGDQDNTLIVDEAVQKAVEQALPILLKKAGLIEDAPAAAAVPATTPATPAPAGTPPVATPPSSGQ